VHLKTQIATTLGHLTTFHSFFFPALIPFLLAVAVLNLNY